MYLARAGLLVVCTLGFAACSSSGSATVTVTDDTRSATNGPGTSDAPDPSSSAEIDVGALEAALTDVLAMPPDQQEATVAAVDARVERELYTMSGLEETLGGPVAADAGFLAAALRIDEQIDALRSSPPDVRSWGDRHPARRADEPTLGEALFGAMISTGVFVSAAVNATNDGTALAGSTNGVTLTGSRDIVNMDFVADITDAGVTTTLRSRVTDLVVCPDLNGQFTGRITLEMSATAAGGTVGQSGTIDIKMIGQVDDSAEISGLDLDIRTQFKRLGGGGGTFADVSVAFGTGTSSRPSSAAINATGDGVTQQFVNDTANLGSFMGTVIATQVSNHARDGWQSGRCVALEPTASPGPKGLRPGATSTVSAAPRSKLGGGPVGGTVTATMAAGGASVEPAGSKVPADATFTYTAPDTVGAGGTVSLEARSKRGVAKASIDFDTAGAYVASGGTEVTFSGTVADLAQPFTLAGAGQGFEVTFSFVPTGTDAGSLTYSGSGAGFTMEGSGTYTIAGADPTPLTLTYNAQGCVNIGGCRATTNAITLTRASG